MYAGSIKPEGDIKLICAHKHLKYIRIRAGYFNRAHFVNKKEKNIYFDLNLILRVRNYKVRNDLILSSTIFLQNIISCRNGLDAYKV